MYEFSGLIPKETPVGIPERYAGGLPDEASLNASGRLSEEASGGYVIGNLTNSGFMGVSRG